ncbi:MAG TPA: hypothetical protein VFW35_01145 [Sphingomicrobium sp.]|nr:hypothetical protein [Sphingomicrobium sp.]
MADSDRSKGKGFTVLRSADEQAEMKRAEQDWANEGGHMSSTSGRVVNRPGEDLPFVAILLHHASERTEHGFATMREAEAFIKRNTPVPEPKLSKLYDRSASEW